MIRSVAMAGHLSLARVSGDKFTPRDVRCDDAGLSDRNATKRCRRQGSRGGSIARTSLLTVAACADYRECNEGRGA